MLVRSRLAHVERAGAWTLARLAGAAAFAGACSSSSNPPGLGGGAAISPEDSGLQTIAVDGSTSPDATAGRDASSDAAAARTSSGDGTIGGQEVDGAAADVEGEEQEIGPPVCREGITWSTIARVDSIAAAGFDQFGAISASALTVAWTSSEGVIYVADRTSNTGDFGAPGVVDPASTPLSNGRVALMPDGLEVIATLADGSSFTAFDRVSIGGAWLPSTSDEFKLIAATISESGGAFAEPVVSADGQSLFYLLTIGDALPILYESAWDSSSHTWQYGQPLTEAEFASQAGNDADGAIGTGGLQVRRPTGASSDRRTLFFFDEVVGHERAAWRDSPSDPFDTFEDLPNLPEVAPDEDCFYVYFHGSDDAGQGLFTGTGP
ncbi:MAG TPA: hypothetical protein VEK07_15795 [Polyangiaceae bacterium]|nr:hypothetical protein [Polyangiaceae bacterium]